MTDKALSLVEKLCEACYQDGGDEKAACNALAAYIEELEQKSIALSWLWIVHHGKQYDRQGN